MRLPQHILKSLVWDRGQELSAHKSFIMATDMPVYFSVIRVVRGTNENTNSLLR